MQRPLLLLPLAILYSCSTPPASSADAGDVIGIDASMDAADDDDADIDQGIVPRLKAAQCRYQIPAELALSEGVDYECGDLVAYEDRVGQSTTLLVHYVRFFSPASSNNATIYFEGGPGGNGSSMVARLGRLGNAFLDSLMLDGDFIVIAQRGTSLSVPSLDCDFGPSCQELTSHLSAYNTAFNADDTEDLRQLLSYDKLNLFGISYGSRLALEVMRRHPEHVRSAILGGIVPSHVVWSAGVPKSFYGALQALDRSCGDDAACTQAYGNLEAGFVAGVDALDTAPVSIGGAFDMDGSLYANLLFRLMYSRSAYPWLPLLIHDLAQRRMDRVEDFLVQVLDGMGNSGISAGLYYSVVCGEMFSPPDTSLFASVNAEVPSTIRDLFSGGWYGTLDACSTWPAGSMQAALAEPVVSSIPTFLGSGTMDPITPSAYADAAALHLSNTLVVTYQNSGHGATVSSECGRQTIFAFLAQPGESIDTSCANALSTQYVMPSQASSALVSMQDLAIDLEQAPLPPYLMKQLKEARKN